MTNVAISATIWKKEPTTSLLNSLLYSNNLERSLTNRTSSLLFKVYELTIIFGMVPVFWNCSLGRTGTRKRISCSDCCLAQISFRGPWWSLRLMRRCTQVCWLLARGLQSFFIVFAWKRTTRSILQSCSAPHQRLLNGYICILIRLCRVRRESAVICLGVGI